LERLKAIKCSLPLSHHGRPDGPSVLGSNAVPYVISNFEYEGQVPVDAFVATDDYLTGNFGQQRLPQPQPRINELPLSLLRG
jgi:hypothetical protein